MNNLKDIGMRRDEILVYSDVTVLFPNNPVPEGLFSVRQHLERCRVSPNHIEAYTTMAEVCMNRNYFMFRGQTNAWTSVWAFTIFCRFCQFFMCDLEVKLGKQKSCFKVLC